MSSYRDEARRALISKAAQKIQNEFLNEAKNRRDALKELDHVEGLLAVLCPEAVSHDRQDAVLLALIAEHQCKRDGRAFALVARAMFAMLDRIYHQRRRYVPDREHDELWGQILDGFTEVLDRYPCDRRTSKVAANLKLEMLAVLRRAREREARAALAVEHLKEEIAPFLDRIGSSVPGEDLRDLVGLGDFVELGDEEPKAPSRDELAAARRFLDQFVNSGVIDRDDRDLLLGVYVHGRSLADVAKRLGIKREAAKKRHVRALVRLRRWR